jgi:transcription-repair coupling factor (superfamily II helicase)
MSLTKLADKIQSAIPINEIKDILDKSNPVNLQRFVGSLPSFLINSISKKFRHLIIITVEEDQARLIESDLNEMELTNLFYFPATNEKPYDKNQVLDPTTSVQRSEILQSLLDARKSILITSVKALFEKISPPEVFQKSSILLKKDDTIEPESLREKLTDQGYRIVPFVDSPGEVAYRGGIMDVFPFTGNYPVRFEFFGDQIDSIREFDPSTQRSVSFLNETRLVPDISAVDKGIKKSIFSYLPKETLVIQIQPDLILQKFAEFSDLAVNAFNDLNAQILPQPSDLYLDDKSYEIEIFDHKRLNLGGFGNNSNHANTLSIEAKPQPDFNSSIKILKSNITDLSKKNYDTWILCDNDGQRDRFEELLGASKPDFKYNLIINSIHEGFVLDDVNLAVYTDHQIFNRYHRPKVKQRKVKGGFSLKEIKDLKSGDYVVHVDYGIGQFQGFTNITVRNTPQEAVIVKYDADSILYVNVSSLHKLQKYSGKDGAVPKITKLGSGEWARKKARTKSQIKDIARDLIELYAKRKSQKAFAFSPDTSFQYELEASFEFEETPDQYSAIQDVKNDMMSEMPMDRLICGDVGFGKTEVAVRAAFKAVSDGKQVALLVPTTILADQHSKTFKKRMGELPVTVEMISRFRSQAEIKDILKKTENGKVDILIGTHRITSKDVKFKDLGLLIIDEEQRFGVGTKEKIKALRSTVDVLTLTATPIPRTLQFSLMGARDLSVINTPPPNRQPVYTEIHTFDSQLIRDAIMQEMSRNGQVFFINNRVQNIEEVSNMIRKLVPNVRVRFAHGQMKGAELEKIIVDFYAHKFDVLVSTNIVENGIDIANANTIIINRADMFGVSELHQLRGRVGRSNRKAFCYLITPPLSDLTIEARKRLMALVEFSELGSGFNIAMRDLDIRGAGDILGGEQSGFINDIGIELYTKILNDAVRELKESEFSDLFKDDHFKIDLPETTVEFDLPAILDKHYVSDDIERLNLYRKLASSTTQSEIDEWVEELVDRFGKLPQNARNLITASRIRLFASQMHLNKVIIRADKLWLECPNAKSDRGGIFYEKGLFQSLLSKIEHVFGKDYKIAQKDDTVRIILNNIPNLNSAFDTIAKIAESGTNHAESVNKKSVVTSVVG